MNPEAAQAQAQSMSQSELTNYITAMPFDQQLGRVNQELNSPQYAGLANTLRDPDISAYNAAKAVSIKYEAPGEARGGKTAREANIEIGEGRGAMAERFNSVVTAGQMPKPTDVPTAFNFNLQAASKVTSNPDAGNAPMSQSQLNAVEFGMAMGGNKFGQAAIENK